MKTHTTAGEELLIHAKEELGESGYLNTAVVEAFFAADFPAISSQLTGFAK